MKRITVKEAKPGMVLARPISDGQGRAIVNQGVSLTQLYISRLEKWEVKELFIEESPEEKPAEAAREAKPAEAPAEEEAQAPVQGAAPEARPAEPEGPRLPPGVYRGPDLAKRIGETFSQVLDDPVMTVLYTVVQQRLLAGSEGGR